LTFGPNMKSGIVDESMVDFYLIFPVDDCGHILKDTQPLATVPKMLPNADCCHAFKYRVELNMPNFQFKQLVVLPGANTGSGASHLDDGLVIPLVDLTTTTTSTMTATVTSITQTQTTQMTQTTSSTVFVAVLQDGSASDSTTIRLAVPLVAVVLLWLES